MPMLGLMITHEITFTYTMLFICSLSSGQGQNLG